MARSLSQRAQPSNFVRADGWEDEEPFRTKIEEMRFGIAEVAFRLATAGGTEDDSDNEGGEAEVAAWRASRRRARNRSKDSVRQWVEERCDVFAKGLSILRTDEEWRMGL